MSFALGHLCAICGSAFTPRQMLVESLENPQYKWLEDLRLIGRVDFENPPRAWSDVNVSSIGRAIFSHFFATGVADYPKGNQYEFFRGRPVTVHIDGEAARTVHNRYTSRNSHQWSTGGNGTEDIPRLYTMHVYCMQLVDKFFASRRHHPRQHYLTNLEDLHDTLLRRDFVGDPRESENGAWKFFKRSRFEFSHGYWGGLRGLDPRGDLRGQITEFHGGFEWTATDPISITPLTSFVLSLLKPSLNSQSETHAWDFAPSSMIENLPNELLHDILQCLDFTSTFRLGHCSRKLYTEILRPQHMWRDFIINFQLIPHLWDLDVEIVKKKDLEGSKLGHFWDWKRLAKDLLQMEPHKGKLGNGLRSLPEDSLLTSLEYDVFCDNDDLDTPVGLCNRYRIYHLIKELEIEYRNSTNTRNCRTGKPCGTVGEAHREHKDLKELSRHLRDGVIIDGDSIFYPSLALATYSGLARTVQWLLDNGTSVKESGNSNCNISPAVDELKGSLRSKKEVSAVQAALYMMENPTSRAGLLPKMLHDLIRHGADISGLDAHKKALILSSLLEGGYGDLGQKLVTRGDIQIPYVNSNADILYSKAAAEGLHDMVATLLKQAQAFDNQEGCLQKAACQAAFWGRLDVLQLLFERQQSFGFEESTTNHANLPQLSPLAHAIAQGRLEIVEWIQRQGRRPQDYTKLLNQMHGLRDAHLAFRDTMQIYRNVLAYWRNSRKESDDLYMPAALHNKAYLLRALLEDIHHETEGSQRGKNAALREMLLQNREDFVESLLKGGADIEYRVKDMTPLQISLYFRMPEIALMLLKYGADPNAKPSVVGSAIQIAIRRLGPQIVNALLDYGATADGITTTGELLIEEAAVRCKLDGLSEGWEQVVRRIYALGAEVPSPSETLQVILDRFE